MTAKLHHVSQCHDGVAAARDAAALIDSIWATLQRVTRVELQAWSHSAERTGWCGHGGAGVCIETQGADCRFAEHGWFSPRHAAPILTTRNVYLWHRDESTLLLAHERQGRGARVPLVRLAPTAERTLTSQHPHLCHGDRYAASLQLRAASIQLDWNIVGPRKNEHLRCIYRW